MAGLPQAGHGSNERTRAVSSGDFPLQIPGKRTEDKNRLTQALGVTAW